MAEIRELLDEVQAGTLDELTVERHAGDPDDVFFVARAEWRGLQISENADEAHRAVRKLWNHLEEAYLDEPDPMEPDWDRLARDAEGEPERLQAEGPAVQ